jgi:hypothetical protein
MSIISDIDPDCQDTLPQVPQCVGPKESERA